MAAKAPENIEHGGYDYEFVREVPDKFVCMICTKVYRNPRMTDCCGQQYCESCLEYWSKKQRGKKSCPHCQEENFNHILIREKQQEIRRLKIYCTHHQEGCQWVGELDSLQTHLNSDSGCGYVEVNCTNKCGRKMKRKDVKSHLTTECPLRRYKCPYCSHVDTYQAVSQRYHTCFGYPLPCPNNCGEGGIKHRDMSAHLETCPLQQVSCTNGCREKIKRKYLRSHLADSCHLRKYKCQYCSHEETYQVDVYKHYGTCPGYPLPCPNKCSESAIRRKDMHTHKQICPSQPVSCTNGCKEKMKRKDLKSHLADICLLRRYKCQYCSHEDTYQVDVSKHYDTCPGYPLPCPNKCGNNGIRRKDMGVHIARCPLEQVSCLNGCGKEMKRKDLKSHLADICLLRRYKCQYCSHEDTYQVVVTKHYDTCLGYPLPCPNKCGESAIRRKDLDTHKQICPLQPVSCTNNCGVTAILRKDMNDHRAVCPLESVECLFKEAGCEEMVARKDTDTHMASNTQQHLVQMMTTFQKRLTAVEESQKQSQIQSQIQFQILQEGISVYTRPLLKTSTGKQKVHMQCVQTLLENPNQLHLKNNGDSFTITMPDFSKYRDKRTVWHSPPFYYRAGYKMRLAVYANGTGAGAGKYVSVSLLLLRGEFDDQLTWPMGKEGDGIEISCKPQKHGVSLPPAAISLCPRCTTTASRQRVPDSENSRVVGSKEMFANHPLVQQYYLLHDSVELEVSIMPHGHKVKHRTST